MLAAALVLSGCAGTEQTTGSSSAVGVAARDFGTLVQRTPRADLLTLEEIRPFLVLGFDIRKQPLLDPSQFNLAALVGPCGKPLATPFAPTTGFVVFRSTETLTLEAISPRGAAGADSLPARLAADLKPGCPEFTETLGPTSVKVQVARTMKLAEVGTTRVGYEQTLTGGSFSHRFVMVAAGGGRATMLVVLTNDPIEPDTLNPVLEKAVAGT